MAKGIDMREIGFSFNTSFNHGKYFDQMNDLVSSGRFYVYLTYPNQFLREPYGSGIAPEIGKAVSCYKLEIHVGYMRVVRRRNKKRAPCNVNWQRHDEKQLIYIATKVGCTPRNWKMSSDLPYCISHQEQAEINRELNKKNGFMPPCRSVETLLRTTKEKGDMRMCLWGKKKYFDLSIFLDEQRHYEEVFLLRSYSLQALVGNSGK